jgi:hypothetical protein
MRSMRSEATPWRMSTSMGGDARSKVRLGVVNRHQGAARNRTLIPWAKKTDGLKVG